MDHLSLNNNDLKACIELACDGVDIHLQDQSKIDVIHKIMYAVATAAQDNHRVMSQLKLNQLCQYTIKVNTS